MLKEKKVQEQCLGCHGGMKLGNPWALAMYEKTLGPEHPHVATCLHNLAELYKAQGRYAEAKPLCQLALAIYEKALGAKHPSVAISLNYLADLYYAQGRYGEAEPLYRRALAIKEKVLGPEHLDVATRPVLPSPLFRRVGVWKSGGAGKKRAERSALPLRHPPPRRSGFSPAEPYPPGG